MHSANPVELHPSQFNPMRQVRVTSRYYKISLLFSDIDVDKPDKKLIIMYLTEMYNCMEGTKARERKVGCCTLNKSYFLNVN